MNTVGMPNTTANWMLSVSESAEEEWEYRTGTQTSDDMPSSVPCQLKFTSDITQDTAKFHAALKNHDMQHYTSNPDEHATEDEPHYEGDVVLPNQTARVKVVVFRGEIVRLYPKDEYVPTTEELARIIDTLHTGFNSKLTHEPVTKEPTYS